MSGEKDISFIHRIPNPVGRPLKFKRPADLWDKFIAYCEWVDANPWQIKTASNALNSRGDDERGNSLRQNVAVKQRAYTLFGFSAFAGIHSKWADFKKAYSEKEGFSRVIGQIENVIIAQQIDGAIIHQFDSNIVARLNGLADKQQMEVTGKDGEEFKWPKLTEKDLEYLKNINGL